MHVTKSAAIPNPGPTPGTRVQLSCPAVFAHLEITLTFSGQFLMPPLWSISPSGCDLTIPLTGSTVRRKYQSNQQWRNTFCTQGTLRFSSSTRFSGLETGVGATATRFPAAYLDVCFSPLHSAEMFTGENGWKKQKRTFKVKGYEQPRVRDRRPSRPVARWASLRNDPYRQYWVFDLRDYPDHKHVYAAAAARRQEGRGAPVARSGLSP